jgi:aminotransferase
LQEGAVAALELGSSYYTDLSVHYQRRRDLFLPQLVSAGFVPFTPRGAYYIMAEFPKRQQMNDIEFSRWLVQEIGVAVVPASSFYRAGDPEAARMVRFCYPKKDETLLEAGRRLQRLTA